MTEHKSAEQRAREIVERVKAWLGGNMVEGPHSFITAAITAAERDMAERCAEEIRASAEYYSEALFLPDGTSVDAISARALRAVLPRLADRIGALVKETE